MSYREITSQLSRFLKIFLSINIIRFLLSRRWTDITDFFDLPAFEPYAVWFLALALFKGIKIIVHTFSYYCLTRRVQIPASSKYSSADVTVIVPTIGDLGEEFHACIQSILACKPAEVIVSVVGNPAYARAVCRDIDHDVIRVIAVKNANKRKQFLAAAKTVKTAILVNADDHVYWPTTFLESALIPFDDPLVGIVGTVKRVIRQRGHSLKESFLNYIACIYLERHNFECTATFNIDGGVFVISGRTQLLQTKIVMREDYELGYLNEYWWFGRVGPMKVDDDNFTTRFMVNHGYKTVFWNQPEALVRTTLGTTGGVRKFKGQLLRWVRTTWRSNPTRLFVETTCWERHAWTTYAMFLSSLVNFALFYDAALFLTLYMATGTDYLVLLSAVLFVTKLIKPLPHLIREPRDVGYFICGIGFSYMHSFIKLWALLTATNIGWTGREGIKPTDE